MTGIAGGLAIQDGLRSEITGAGTGSDKSTLAHWAHGCGLSQYEIEAAYRTNWLVRKVHDLPPFDMTREWRDWQAEKEEITKLEAEERRLGIRGKVQEALGLARLWGGGALILGIGQGTSRTPAPANNIQAGALRYIHVVSRYELRYEELETNILSPFFGQPRLWIMDGANGQRVEIHPSRVIPFVGQRVPRGASGAAGYRTGGVFAAYATDPFWGDPLLLSIDSAMKNAESSQAGVAALILEAKIDTIKFKNLSELVTTDAKGGRLMNRLAINAQARSLHGTNVMDTEDEWETRQLAFANLDKLMESFAGFASAATDIPQTRLLGRSPAGMNSTGDGDERNYSTMISSKQEVELGPLLDRLDEYLIPSALGSKPDTVRFLFAPLTQMTEKEKADIFKTKMEGVDKVANGGYLPDSALASGVSNMLLEDGVLPGLDEALKDAEAAGEIPSILEEPDPGVDPITGEPIVAPEPGEEDEDEDVPPMRKAANDALTEDERKGIIDRLWRYLIGEPAKKE